MSTTPSVTNVIWTLFTINTVKSSNAEDETPSFFPKGIRRIILQGAWPLHVQFPSCYICISNWKRWINQWRKSFIGSSWWTFFILYASISSAVTSSFHLTLYFRFLSSLSSFFLSSSCTDKDGQLVSTFKVQSSKLKKQKRWSDYYC